MKFLTFIFILFINNYAFANASVHIAVASNFLATLNVITKDFTQQTGIKVITSNGSTGMLYAQIKRGAPYDIFFSADKKRPLLLEEQNLIVKNSRFTYAIGRLVVWSLDDKKVSPYLDYLDLNNPNLHFISIANPRTSPYGAASVQVLKRYGLYNALKAQNKIALGQNVGRVFHHVATGNAQLGFLAKSYMLNPNKPIKGSYFVVDPSLHKKIIQQAVILKGRDTKEVKQFIEFFNSAKVRQIIKDRGYDLPISGS